MTVRNATTGMANEIVSTEKNYEIPFGCLHSLFSLYFSSLNPTQKTYPSDITSRLRVIEHISYFIRNKGKRGEGWSKTVIFWQVYYSEISLKWTSFKHWVHVQFKQSAHITGSSYKSKLHHIKNKCNVVMNPQYWD